MTRKAHFFWLTTGSLDIEMANNLFVSAYTWMIHHQHWTTTLWTNARFSGALYDELVSMGLRIESIDRVADQINVSSEVNWHKWRTLLTHGGMILDLSDTITVGNFDQLYESSDKLNWMHFTPNCDQMGNGWICVSKPNSDIARYIMFRMGGCHPNKRVLGGWEFLSLAATKLCRDVHRQPVSQHIVLGYHCDDMRANIMANKMTIPDGCLQLHMYWGNVLDNDWQTPKRAMLRDYYADLPRWQEERNIVTQAFARSVRNSKETR